jgi:histone deacetylase 1/2
MFPNASKNLLSVNKLTVDNHVVMKFHPHFFCIKDLETKKTLVKRPCLDSLYPLVPISTRTSKQAFATIKPSSSTCNHCLGNPSSFVVNKILKKHNISFSPEINTYICDPCQLAKSHQLPYLVSTSVSTVPWEQVFSDVWGPAPLFVGKYSYYVSFIDDFSKFTWIYLLKKSSEVHQVFLNFQQLVERKFDRKIITMQIDWGG